MDILSLLNIAKPFVLGPVPNAPGIALIVNGGVPMIALARSQT